MSIPASLAGGDFIVFEVLDGVLWFAVGTSRATACRHPL